MPLLPHTYFTQTFIVLLASFCSFSKTDASQIPRNSDSTGCANKKQSPKYNQNKLSTGRRVPTTCKISDHDKNHLPVSLDSWWKGHRHPVSNATNHRQHNDRGGHIHLITQDVKDLCPSCRRLVPSEVEAIQTRCDYPAQAPVTGSNWMLDLCPCETTDDGC